MTNKTNRKGISRVLQEKFFSEDKAVAFKRKLIGQGYSEKEIHVDVMPYKKSKFVWYVTYNTINH